MEKNDPVDMLHGTDAIAGHLGMTARQLRHRAGAGELPTFKLGRIVCATRSGLNAWLAKQEAKALAARAAPAPVFRHGIGTPLLG